MKSQVLHTVWCYISGKVAGEIWNWSLLGVKELHKLGDGHRDRTSTQGREKKIGFERITRFSIIQLFNAMKKRWTDEVWLARAEKPDLTFIKLDVTAYTCPLLDIVDSSPFSFVHLELHLSPGVSAKRSRTRATRLVHWYRILRGSMQEIIASNAGWPRTKETFGGGRRKPQNTEGKLPCLALRTKRSHWMKANRLCESVHRENVRRRREFFAQYWRSM